MDLILITTELKVEELEMSIWKENEKFTKTTKQ